MSTEYDVFISYASKDEDAVEQIARRLVREELNPFLDKWDLIPGEPRQEAWEEALDNSATVAVFIGPAGISSWHNEVMRDALETRTRDQSYRVIPVLLPGAAIPSREDLPRFLARLTWVDFRSGLDDDNAFHRLVSGIKGESPGRRLTDELPETAKLPSGSIMPYTRNEYFTGRSIELETLDKALQPGRPFALVGMGGIGKTQLAVEYAYTKHKKYRDGIFWINATHPLSEEFANLAKSLGWAKNEAGNDDAARRTWEYLQAHPNALLVFDNLAEPINLNQEIPPGVNLLSLPCYILFTTRQRDPQTGFKFLDLRVLPEEAALEILLRARSEILDTEGESLDNARRICASLGWLPLALELAGAYLGAYPEIDLAGYLERLETEGGLKTVQDTVLRPEHLPTYPEIIITATLRTQLERSADDEWAQLLFKAAGQFPEAEMIPIAWLGLLTGIATERPRPGYPIPMTPVLNKLRNASLIEELTEDRLRLHPLVHEFAASMVPNDQQHDFRIALEDNLIANLASPKYRYQRALVAGECLLGLLKLGWDLRKMHPVVIEALRELVTGETLGDSIELITEAQSRRAGFLLVNLGWLEEAEDIEDTLILLERIIRYIASPNQRRALEQSITTCLDSEKLHLSEHQKSQLLIYRAGLRGQIGDADQDLAPLDAAASDYEAADALIHSTISENWHKEAQKWLARINLGIGNLNMIRAIFLDHQDERATIYMQTAIEQFLAALQRIQTSSQDALLEVGIHKELAKTYALLQKSNKAEQHYIKATEALERVDDTEIRAEYSAVICADAALLYWDLNQYQKAYSLSQQAITLFKDQAEESEALAIEYLNSGDYLSEMGKISYACECWRIARTMAKKLAIVYLEREAIDRLRNLCKE